MLLSGVSSDAELQSSSLAQRQVPQDMRSSEMNAWGISPPGFTATDELVTAFQEGGQRVIDICGENMERWALYRSFLVHDFPLCCDDCANQALTLYNPRMR